MTIEELEKILPKDCSLNKDMYWDECFTLLINDASCPGVCTGCEQCKPVVGKTIIEVVEKYKQHPHYINRKRYEDI